MLYAVIVAGGQGTRLWPASRKSSPKQVQPFAGGESLLRRTYDRLTKILPPERIFIETNVDYAREFLRQLPQLTPGQLILEPEPKNTAAAVGLAAAVLYKIDPEAVMINVWADHHYKDELGYLKIIRAAADLLKKYPDYLIDMLAKPTYPSGAFDYFAIGDKLEEYGGVSLFKVAGFARKPDLKTAKKYLAAENFYWNTSNFVWRVDTLLDMYKEYVPEMYAGLMKMADRWGNSDWQRTVQEEFPKLERNTVDYAIFEKTSKIILIPADVGWRDVGNWKIMYDILTDRGDGVVTRGKVRAIGTKDTLIFNENKDKLVAVVGLEDLVVVDTPDSLLVMKKSKDQDIKKMIKEIEEEGELEYL